MPRMFTQPPSGLTPKHLALAAKVPVKAQAYLRELRDRFPTRVSAETHSDEFATIREKLLEVGIEVERGSGVEKVWIGFGDGFVIKVGCSGFANNPDAIARECELSRSLSRRHCLAAAVLLDEQIEVQERGIATVDEYLGKVYNDQRLYDRVERNKKRVSRIMERLGMGDYHGGNIAVFADGSVKAIDYSL